MFNLILIAVAGTIAMSAAYFSVVGIASIFAASYIPAIVMATGLEAGKLVAASYLYRYWRITPLPLRGVLGIFIVVLMFVTSVGIFGFLSQGYQKTSEAMRILTVELDSYQSEITNKKKRMREIDQQISQLPYNYVTSRIRLSREFREEKKGLENRIGQLELRIQELQLKLAGYESHIGPISYVAKIIHTPQNDIVFYAILLIVFIFDPLAVSLVLATNIALMRTLERKKFLRRGLFESTTDTNRAEQYVTEEGEIIR